jgi:hypothetical protein
MRAGYLELSNQATLCFSITHSMAFYNCVKGML